MGSPISPILADIVMDDLETACLNQLKTELNITPLFYYRYVDDILLCIEKDRILDVLTVFNSYDNHLEFTYEREKNNVINFLDLTLIRQQNHIITNWFRKDLFTTRTLNYFSNHTHHQKKNVVYNLIDRAIKLSDPQFHDANIILVRKILKDNDYERHFIDKHIKIRLNTIQLPNTNNDNNNYNNTEQTNNILNIPIPLNNKRTYDRISRSLRELNVKAVPRIKKPFRQVIRRCKDLTPKDQKTASVYRISCKNCPAEYVGQTKRPLGERIDEHKKFRDKNSVVSTHRIHCDHEFDWDNTIILDTEKNPYLRDISEMLFIESNPDNLNKKHEVKRLNQVYKNISRKLR